VPALRERPDKRPHKRRDAKRGSAGPAPNLPRPDEQIAEFNLNLSFGESRRPVAVRASMEPIDQTELLPILQQFDNEVVTLAEEESARKGKTISCCAGCGACCRQLVPVAAAEARRLSALVASMEEPRRTTITKRFTDAVETYEQAGLLDQMAEADRIPDESARGEFGMAVFRVGVPCPFLENESCGIYPDRPLACREFLVTSPAENCRNPGPDNIERVPLPAAISETLYRFSTSGERQDARWMPLVLSLRYAEGAAKTEPLPKQPGGEFVQKFLGQLANHPR
jgi:Fe-S-cluster containining protein